ncbi:hypothetical protein ETAE_2468 [Edwardsiella piscicida]|uniref:Uncharacterized protein n=1 Tax=Edwardsiella piscicida TaxID=1263550 RepID=A0AAU8PNI3_EDWPI|nr:hypothetical protein ETAE_2468 [Edwardsiella tarda EIB202]
MFQVINLVIYQFHIVTIAEHGIFGEVIGMLTFEMGPLVLLGLSHSE